MEEKSCRTVTDVKIKTTVIEKMPLQLARANRMMSIGNKIYPTTFPKWYHTHNEDNINFFYPIIASPNVKDFTTKQTKRHSDFRFTWVELMIERKKQQG